MWLKRDLRLSDINFAERCGMVYPVLLLYCFEPMLLADPHYSARHWRFVRESLQDIQQRVPLGSLYVIKQEVLSTLTQLHERFGIAQLFSHQEVGLDNTFARDQAVQGWCEQQGVTWHEAPYRRWARLSQRIIGSHWKK